MDLRPRLRQSFSGFTKSEVEKMEQLHNDYTEQTLEDEFCKKIARLFNRSSGRAGKPVVKWTEVQSWFQKNAQQGLRRKVPLDEAKNLPVVLQTPDQNKAASNPRLHEDVEDVDLSRLDFEAKSPKDGAWYDVDTFRSHRFLDSGEAEVLVRYVGFGSDEDEWVNIRDSVRVRSVTLDPTECQKVKVGDLVVCFQNLLIIISKVTRKCTYFRNKERQDQARYYDARVLEIQRRLHDIRGCRCLFSIKYYHDNVEEKVRLGRLCCRPITEPKST